MQNTVDEGEEAKDKDPIVRPFPPIYLSWMCTDHSQAQEKCQKCGNVGLSYKIMQLRSADEGSTVFYKVRIRPTPFHSIFIGHCADESVHQLRRSDIGQQLAPPSRVPSNDLLITFPLVRPESLFNTLHRYTIIHSMYDYNLCVCVMLFLLSLVHLDSLLLILLLHLFPLVLHLLRLLLSSLVDDRNGKEDAPYYEPATRGQPRTDLGWDWDLRLERCSP